MARARKPIEQHIIDGTYRRDRHGPLPTAGEDGPLPVKPADLNGAAGAVWDRIMPLLVNVARERDTPMLVELCRWCAELGRVRAKLKQVPPGGKGYNQLLQAAAVCSDRVSKVAERFGMTPSDRARLRAESAAPVKAKVPTRPKTNLDKLGGPG